MNTINYTRYYLHNNIISAPPKKYLCVFLIALSFLTSCKKFVEVESPATSSTSQEVYTSDATAAAVLTGVYTTMSLRLLSQGTSLSSFMTLYPGLSADEFTLLNSVTGNYIFYYANNLNNRTAPNLWTQVYPIIYILNSAIEGLQLSISLTPSVKQQLLGEAYFLRGFYYFYLTNLYGDVPLITSTNYKTNSIASRTPQAEVYAKVLSDLQIAEANLNTNYYNADILTTSIDKLRPTKFAATALMARVYLFVNKNSEAEAKATEIISNNRFNINIPLLDVFKKNSSEAIWQLQPVNLGWNTEDARFFTITSAGPNNSNPVYLSQSLLDSFEIADGRKDAWTTTTTAGGKAYTYASKYKSATLNASVTEYQTVLRIGEQYLIRAEARAKQGKITGNEGALADINTIRIRAGLTNVSSESQAEVLKAIQHERQIELFCEWGNRWLDLKRNNTVNQVMTVASPLKGGTWDNRKQYYPIPAADILANPNLVQNPIYE